MSILKAIIAINPNANVRVDNNDINQIEWFDTTPIASSDIQAKVIELKTKSIAEAYKLQRASEYKPLAEQLDMQYWDSVNGTTTWKDHIAEVKANNPKPTE